jgi:hypothetical protein
MTLLAALCACSLTRDDPQAASKSPVSQADAARLIEAVDAYTRFNSAFDLFLSGEDPEVALKGLVTQRFLQSVLQDLQENSRSTVTTGASSFSEEKLVDTEATASDDVVALAVCRDVSTTEIVDAKSGEDVTPADRRLRIPLVIGFQRSSDNDERLLVEEVTQWNEESYCR